MKIIAITQKGPSKTENEDRIIVGKNIIAEGIFQTQLPNGIVAVADGVGGNNAGAVASHYIAKKLSFLIMSFRKPMRNCYLFHLSVQTTKIWQLLFLAFHFMVELHKCLV